MSKLSEIISLDLDESQELIFWCKFQIWKNCRFLRGCYVRLASLYISVAPSKIALISSNEVNW